MSQKQNPGAISDYRTMKIERHIVGNDVASPRRSYVASSLALIFDYLMGKPVHETTE